MGRQKRWMLEQADLEMQDGALVSFYCPNPECENWVEQYTEVPFPNLTAEKQSDISQTLWDEFFCTSCECVFDGSITHDGAFLTVELDEYPNLDIEIEAPDIFYYSDDDYLWDTIPEDPSTIFRENLQELACFVEKSCNEFSQTLENRMAVIQAWSSFETYLRDRLAKHLDQNSEALIRFSTHDEAVKEMKFSATDILSSGITVDKRVIGTVRARLYHKFGQSGKPCPKSSGVPAWYRIGMQIEIIPDLKTLDRLREIAVIRHDCVHRNGKDKDDDERTDIIKSTILEILKIMQGIADHIECEMSKKQPSI